MFKILKHTIGGIRRSRAYILHTCEKVKTTFTFTSVVVLASSFSPKPETKR